MKREICLVHYSSAPGGIEVLMPEIIRKMPGTRFRVFVIRPPKKEQINVYEGQGIDVTFGAPGNLRAAALLWCYVRRNRKAIFHGFNTGPFFLFIIRLAGAASMVYSVRGTRHYVGRLQKAVRKAVWYLAITRRSLFIANSEYSCDVFIRYLPRVRPLIRVIYNHVWSDRTRMPEKTGTGAGFNIIYVGRLATGKNLFHWIDIAAEIHRKRADVKFHLFGDGALRDRLEEYSRTAGMEECLFFRGYEQDLSVIYGQADLMLFLSEYESFGNVVVESVLCGTPVLVADLPSMREIFRNYPQFILTTVAQPAEMVLERIGNLVELQMLTREAAAEFRERFSVEQHISGLLGVYESFGREVV